MGSPNQSVEPKRKKGGELPIVCLATATGDRSPVNVFMALVLVRAHAGYNLVHFKFQKLYYWINMEWCLCPCLSAIQVTMAKSIGMIFMSE